MLSNSLSQQLLGFDLFTGDIGATQYPPEAYYNVYEPPHKEVGRYDDVR